MRRIDVLGYRDLAGLGKASIRLDVCNVYRRIVAASKSTASYADTKRVRAVLHSNHIQSIKLNIIILRCKKNFVR